MKPLPVMMSLIAGLMIPLASSICCAEENESADVKIDVAVVTMDNQQLIRATVTRQDKPVSGADVSFLVHRTFGDMSVGHDQTYDDGTAYTPFPADVPGSPLRQLTLIVRIDAPETLKGQTGSTAAIANVAPHPTIASIPRALWAPQVPLSLLLTILASIVVVWGCYLYVVHQLAVIRKGAIQ